MSQPSLVELITKNIEDLRTTFRSYESIQDESTRKQFRHQVYTKNGGFGKEIMKLAPLFKELEVKISGKNGGP